MCITRSRDCRRYRAVRTLTKAIFMPHSRTSPGLPPGTNPGRCKRHGSLMIVKVSGPGGPTGRANGMHQALGLDGRGYNRPADVMRTAPDSSSRMSRRVQGQDRSTCQSKIAKLLGEFLIRALILADPVSCALSFWQSLTAPFLEQTRRDWCTGVPPAETE